MAVLPYFIMQCRIGLDCNLLVNMITISVWMLSIALEKRRRILFVLAGILWGATYYTYALSYIPNTIILLILIFYIVYLKRDLWKDMVAFCLPIGIIALPLLVMVFINQFDLPQINIGMITIPRLPEYRAGEFVFSMHAVLKNIGIVLSSILTKDWIPYNAFDRYYTMYSISVSIIVYAFYDYTKYVIDMVKKKKLDNSLIWWLIFVVYFITGCFLGGDCANVNKMNAIFFAQFFILLWGIRRLYFLIKERYQKLPGIFIGTLGMIYLLNFCFFADYYFAEYPSDVYPQMLFADTYENMLQHLYDNHLEYDRIYIDCGFNNSYIYYLLSTGMDPHRYNLPENGVANFENYYFSWPEPFDEKAIYIIRDTNEKYIKILEENGFSERYRDGMFLCYY